MTIESYLSRIAVALEGISSTLDKQTVTSYSNADQAPEQPRRLVGRRPSRDELAQARAVVARDLFPKWQTRTPSKRQLMEALSTHSEAALHVRQILEDARLQMHSDVTDGS